MINRTLKAELQKRWDSGKVLLVLGPRQVGKTTLLEQLCREHGEFLLINGDDSEVRTILENAGEARLRQLIGNHTTVFVDEAQRINNIGLLLKIIHDQLKNVRLVVSGSSALEIANSINEPLTGRKWEYNLYPISWQEFSDYVGYFEAVKQLETRLLYGMYPDIITQGDNGQATLKQLAGSYLYKDLLSFGGIRKPELLEKLLVALALQMGSEVSYNELSQLLRVDRGTVEQYIALLEQAFVVFRLNPLSRNIRNEINSSRKIYFIDNGIRNALIGDFKPLAVRQDVGALWENFLMSERRKRNAYSNWYVSGMPPRCYFWRTYQQQEIDYVEEYDGNLHAYEFKWNPKAKARFPKTFIEAYPQATTQVITPDNFSDFVMG